MAVTSAQVQELYVGLLGRAADKAGLDYWLGQLNAEGSALTLENLRANFVNEQPEYAATYGSLARADLVTAIYQNLFERTPSADEVSYWANGTVSADQMVVAFLNGASAADKQVVGNKTYVAETYTNTVGASYNAAAAKAVVENVDGTAASVSTALNAITTGTLAGQVPALGLIKAYAAAQDAVAAYGKTVAASNAALDTNKDGSVSSTEASAALQAAQNERAQPANGGTATVATLTANVTNETNDLAAAKTAAVAITGGAAAITAYDNAVAADTAADAAVAAYAAASASAQAGLNASVSASGSAVTYASLSDAAGVAVDFANAAEVIAFLADTSSSATLRAALVTELNKVATYGAEVVKAGDLGLAAAKTQAALDTATTTLEAIDSDADATNGSEGASYISAKADLASATTTLANAQTADAKVAAVKAVVDQYTALTKASTDAGTAITQFETNNSTKVDIHEIGTGAVAETATATKSDVFFFGAAVATANDGTISSFGSGDSIVLNSALNYNNGALTAGDNNKSEFFLIQKGDDVQLVIETAAYGSSDAVTTAASTADHVAVITLTGISVADLTVSNGVVSHVA